MHNPFMRRIALGLAIASVPLVVGCSATSGSDDDSDPIQMGSVAWLGYGAWPIAEAKGYFDDHGIEVDEKMFNSGPDRNAAMASGDLDVANVGTQIALQMVEAGLPVTVVLMQDFSLGADAIAVTGNVDSVEDLAGKKVAYAEGTPSDLVLSAALADAGLTKDDIEAVPLAPSDAGAALIAGRVDAAVTYEPYLSEATAQDPNVNILYEAGEHPGLVSDVLVVRNDYLEGHEEEVQALVDAYGDAMSFLDKNQDEARTLIAEAVGSDVEKLASAFDGVQFIDLEENRAQLVDGGFTESVLPVVTPAAISAGIIQDEVDLSDVIDSTFVRNAE